MKAEFANEKLAKLQETYQVNRKNAEQQINVLESSVAQFSILNNSLGQFIEEIVKEANLKSESEGPEGTISVLADGIQKIKSFVENEPLRITNQVRLLSLQIEMWDNFHQELAITKAQISNREQHLEELKDKIDAGENLEKRNKIGDRPEKIKDVRIAASELAKEKKKPVKKSRKKPSNKEAKK
jgi:hypothetical protein